VEAGSAEAEKSGAGAGDILNLHPPIDICFDAITGTGLRFRISEKSRPSLTRVNVLASPWLPQRTLLRIRV
jgi:hypothetical protein